MLLTYALAAVAEIGGCFAFWAVIRLGRSPWWLVAGMASLIAFAWLLTRVDTAGLAVCECFINSIGPLTHTVTEAIRRAEEIRRVGAIPSHQHRVQVR